jgi:hypothetical protein
MPRLRAAWGARLAVVREAVALAAYRTGRYADALAEFRTARRLNGSQTYLPHMADCERGLGAPNGPLPWLGTRGLPVGVAGTGLNC